MSRYTITVTRDGRSGPNVVIGYDPWQRTLFLQASPTRLTTISLSPHRARPTTEWNH